MENQVSGPLGTDVCSPLDSSQSATEAVQEPGPLTTLYSHKSFTPGTEGEELCSSVETQTSKSRGQALKSIVLTRPARSENRSIAGVIRDYRNSVYSPFQSKQ